ncbi:MAG: hypothetical protein K8T90_13125 [Planctomycetes bacterium]|nr:hypothetical protein [Planctomycetota bacterium]
MTPVGSIRPAALRAAGAAVAFAAALGPTAAGDRGDLCRVLLVDVSASCGGEVPSPAEMAALADGIGRGDRVAVVAFADGAETIAEPTTARDVAPRTPRLGRWATSLAAGLRAAATMRPPGGRLEILVATDGNVTDDAASIDAAVTTLCEARGGVELRTLRRAGVALPSSVAELRGPGRAALGEVIALEARGVAAEGGATVELLGGGAVIERRRVDRSGAFRLVFTRIADASGLVSWEARTPETADVRPPAARVVVTAPESCVVVSHGPMRRELAAALGAGARAIDVSREAPTAQDFASRIDGAGAVVLDDTAPVELRPLEESLRAFVRGGGGLLLFGGPASFGAGGWRPDGPGDGIESILPLRCEPPDSAGVAVYLAIDGSGSMGEPWAAAGAPVLRDAAARAAARALVRAAPRGATMFVRRFREFPVPQGGAPSLVDLTGPAELTQTRRADGVRAIDALPAPGGSTAFVPVLTEAADLLASRSEPTRIALFLTDGRSSEAPSAIEAAIRRLLAAGVRVAVVAPGRLDAGAADASFLVAAASVADSAAAPAGVSVGVAIRAAVEPERLADVLVETQREMGDGRAILSARDVAPSADAATLDASGVPPADWPRHALQMNRTWPAPDAVVLARSPDGAPLAAVRAEPGAGRVGAIAARVGDPAWLDGDGGTSMASAMLGAVRRRGAATVRVVADGATLRARFDLRPGTGTPARAVFSAARVEIGSSPLAGPDRDGVMSADTVAGADRVDFVTADGSVVAAAGVDRVARPELLPAAPLDVDALAAHLRRVGGSGAQHGDRPDDGVSLRPWLAAVAVVLLVASSIKSPSRSTR